jgi:hypothetical protein
MTRRRCCCEEERECAIHHTVYPDADELDEWTVLAGTWTDNIAPDILFQEAGNNTALIRLDIPHPARHETGFIDVRCIDVQVDANFLILCNYLDANNYLYVRVYRWASNKIDLAVGKCSAGVETDSESVTITVDEMEASDFDVGVCYGPLDDDGNILLAAWAAIGTTGLTYTRVYDEIAAHDNGYYVGLANRSTEVIRFEHFKWDEHTQTNTYGGQYACWWCMCTCEDEIIPPGLLATITSTCTAIDGWTFDLDYDESESYFTFLGSQYGWTNSTGPQTCDNIRLEPELWCNSDDCDENEPLPTFWCPQEGLKMSTGSEEPCTSDPILLGNASGTCNPLNLTFGPYTFPDDEGHDCGCDPPCSLPITFYIVLTER